MKMEFDRGSRRGSAVPSNILWLACGIVTLLLTTGCQTNPYTGRWQLMMMPMSQEVKMGAQAYAEVKSDPKMKPSTDPREIEPVKRVAARVIEAAKRSKYSEMANQFEWEVTVIKDDKTMNAFALPGGKIAVYTGIFPVAKTEAGLAAVMGHEVVHALARQAGLRHCDPVADDRLPNESLHRTMATDDDAHVAGSEDGRAGLRRS